MKIAVLGASGQTGPVILKEILKRGHEAIAICRSPEKMPFSDPKMEIRQADAYDAEAVQHAIAGADAVVTSVGATNFSDTRPLNTVAHRNVMDAMKFYGQDRLVVISSFGAVRNVKRKGLRRKLYLWLRRKYYRDMAAMEEMVTVEWPTAALLRVPALHHREAKHTYITTDDGTLPNGLSLGRQDLAHYIVDTLEQDKDKGKIIAIVDEGSALPTYKEMTAPTR